MKLLFDQNISHRVVNLIQEQFPLARHVKDFNLQFATDKEIWNYAKIHNFCIVTFDADFYDFVTFYGHPPKVIWLRPGNTTSSNLARIISANHTIINSFLEEAAFENIGCLEINQ